MNSNQSLTIPEVSTALMTDLKCCWGCTCVREYAVVQWVESHENDLSNWARAYKLPLSAV